MIWFKATTMTMVLQRWIRSSRRAASSTRNWRSIRKSWWSPHLEVHLGFQWTDMKREWQCIVEPKSIIIRHSNHWDFNQMNRSGKILKERERESRRRLTGLGARKDDNFLHTGCLFHKVMLVVAKEFLSHRPFSALCVAAYPLLMKLGLHGIVRMKESNFESLKRNGNFSESFNLF